MKDRQSIKAPIIEEVEHLKSHDHVCLIYDTPQEWQAIVVPFIKLGLERNEKCIYIVDTHTAKHLRSNLEIQGVDVASLEASGQLVILRTSETYTRDGSFVPDRMISLLISETEKAVAQGYRMLRVTAEMTWILRSLSGPEKLLEYEAKLNRDFFSKYPCLAICQYASKKVAPQIIKDVVMTHPLLARDSRIYQNHYYTPTSKFLTEKLAEAEVRRWLNNIEREQHAEEHGRFLSGLLEHSSQPFVVAYPDRRLFMWNTAFRKLTGYTDEELRKITSNDLTPAEWREHEAQMLEELHRTGRPHLYEKEYIRKDGSRVPVEIFRHQTADTEGNVEYHYSFVTDITGRKLAEKALWESQEKYRTIFENVNDVVVCLNRYGNVIDVNKKGEEVFGYKKEEVIGKNFAKLGVLSLKDLPKMVNLFRELVKGKPPSLMEIEAKHKDGSTALLEVNTALVKKNGKLEGTVAIVRNITERKRAEEMLGESEEKFRNVVERANDGICIIQDRLVKYANPQMAEMYGGSVEEIINTPFVNYIHPDDIPMVINRYNQRMAGEQVPSVYEITLRCKDGREVYGELNIGLINYLGKPAELVIVRDVTERKRAEEDLKLRAYLLNNATDSIFLLDLEGNVIYANEAACQIHGYTWEEFMTLNILQLVAPEQQHLVQPVFRQMLNKGHHTFESTHTCKDGSLLPVENHVSIIEIQGKKHTLSVLRNITERKRAEETLRQSEQNFRNLFENAVAGIFQTTPEGRLISVNNAFANIYGYNSSSEMLSEITDIAPQLYVNKEDREELIRIVDKQEIVESREIKVRHRNGKTIWLFLSLRGIKDDSGKLLRMEGVCVNITDRKQVEDELKQSYQKLQKTIESTIQTIALTSETRDPYTAGHQRRVAKLACAMAEEMGLSKEQIETIRIAGTLHDIGKINVPAEILSKPGRLSEIEMSLIKTHPDVGRDILKTLELPWTICPIVLQHHERMDGSGYPSGLLGKDISIEAKILAVADVVEAMASHRPYRPALGLDKALEEIAKNKGKLYDPDVAAACLNLFTEKSFKLE